MPKEIITPSKWYQAKKTLKTIASGYIGSVLLVLILTLPTKAIWYVVSFLWNLI